MTEPTNRPPTRYPCGCPDRGLSSLGESCCTGCGRHFSSPNVFDAHWVGAGDNRHCVDPATIVHGPAAKDAGKPKYELRQRASGPVWATAYEGEHPFAHRREQEAAEAEAADGGLFEVAS